MGVYAAGQIVFLPFPFSDLTRTKLRPALLIAYAGNADWIACQITSNPYRDILAISISSVDFETGGLQQISYVRPGKLFSANESLFAVPSGTLKSEVVRRVREAVVQIIWR